MTSKLYKVLPLAVALLMFSAPALAQDGGADFKGGVGLGAGLAMARNPQAGGDIRTAMLLGLAFPESLVLFALAIAFLLQGKI